MLFVLLACAPAADLVFTPAILDFGEVDFTGEIPDEGYATASVTLSNEGTSPVQLSLPAYDTDRLCLAGYTTQAFPVDLGEAAPGSAFTFIVGVCAYISGEIDTVVETGLEVDTDGASLSLPITFTPIRTAD